MKTSRSFLLSMFAQWLCCSASATDFYVVPTGNDANPGTKAKPFATLEAAVAAARIAGAAPSPSSGKSEAAPPLVITPNEFEGSDVERINRAIDVAATAGGRVVIPPKNIRGAARSEIWLLDSAILLRSNTTLELDNCRIKLSDRCRDNMMRNVKRDNDITRSIHIRGIGNVVLEGADHPRATGDGGKTLGTQTYGTDAGVAGENQKGDGRNHGIFLTSVKDFSLENFTIKDSHCWAINLERCAKGTLRNLDFASSQFKVIDGVRRTILNQDGIDLRMGCHDILIENISGYTGDDLIALTGLSRAGRYAGARDDIHHVTIENIKGYCRGGNHILRLLNNGGVKIHDILIDGLTDTTPVDVKKADFAWGNSRAAIKIGDKAYGGMAPLGDTFNVTIRNVTSRARIAILIAGSLSESTISNVVQYGTTEPVTVESGPQYVRNVTVTNVHVIKN